MKTLLVKLAIFTFVSLVIFTGCNTDNDNDSNNDLKSEIEDNVKKGTWRITKFMDDGDDESNHFTGYNFTFGDNNVLTASNTVNTYTGTWIVSDGDSDDDSDDDSQDDLDFNIFFAGPDDFKELSDDWDLISQSSTKIELIDVSDENGGADYLTFEKN